MGKGKKTILGAALLIATVVSAASIPSGTAVAGTDTQVTQANSSEIPPLGKGNKKQHIHADRDPRSD